VVIVSVTNVSVRAVSVAVVIGSAAEAEGAAVADIPAAGGALVDDESTTGEATTGAGSRAAIFGGAEGSGELGGAFLLLAAGLELAVLADVAGVDRRVVVRDVVVPDGVGLDVRGLDVVGAGFVSVVVVVMRREVGERTPACVATNARDSAAG
jgi:hypothetical protein